VLRVGDSVTVHPKGNTSVISGLTRAGVPTDIAVPGDAIAIELADDLDVGKFDVIVATEATQPVDTKEIVADVCWLAESTLKVGDTLIIRHPSGEAHGSVARIIHRLNLDSLQNSPADILELNDIARIEIQLKTPLVVDAYSASRVGGSAIAIEPVTNATVGALMVVAGKTPASSPSPSKKKFGQLVRGFFTSKEETNDAFARFAS
jgi:sulfate adenylyltransferase subunit 1